MTRLRPKAIVVGLCILPCTLLAQPRGRLETKQALRRLDVSAQEIQVSLRYGPRRTEVRGDVVPGSDVVVTLTGPARAAVFSRMGKVGPFWMSVGKVRFRHVPEMYQIRSTHPLAQILSTEEQARHQLGLEALRASLQVEPGPSADIFVNQLITSREAVGLYDLGDGGVTCREGRFTTSFTWPASVPEGEYTIEAFAVRDGIVVGTRSEVVAVREVGIGAAVSRLARSHGIVYGLLAVGLAVVVGALMHLACGGLGRLVSSRRARAPGGSRAG